MKLRRAVQSALTTVLLGLAVVGVQAPARASEVWGPYYLMLAASYGHGTPQCLADPNASTANNVQMILWNCGSGGQKFSNESPVSATDYWTFNYANGRCLAPQSSSRWAAVVQTTCTTSTTTRWAYHRVSSNVLYSMTINGKSYLSTTVFTIQNLNSGQCIGTDGNSVARGAGVSANDCQLDLPVKWVQFHV